ncbi:hypothetical protein ACFLW8_06190, partial [Chloroflexota bacterium]
LTVSWFIGAISAIIASLAITLLPGIWDDWKVSSFVKFPAWLILAAISSFVPGFTSWLGLSLLQWIGIPLRATAWWLGIQWGF